MTGPFNALTQAFVQIFNFSGRATRAEFWWVFLAFSIFGIAAAVADVMSLLTLAQTSGQAALLSVNPLTLYSTFVMLVTIVPFTSLGIRRLHDAGFSGFWWLASFVPVVGSLLLLVMYCLPSENRTTVRGTPRVAAKSAKGTADTVDTHKRAMQGYAVLFEKNRPVTPEIVQARKSEISEYYRNRVLKSATPV